MHIKTSLPGRVRNTNFPRSRPLMPLFEAIINSIQAIEECENSTDEGLIKIAIKREAGQPTLAREISEQYPPIIGFTIEDNGIGFTGKNFNSFQTLDTDYKRNKGGRGIGRLLWLKCFKNIEIKSTYMESRSLFERSFSFNAQSGIDDSPPHKVDKSAERRTIVTLRDTVDVYRKKLPKTTSKILSEILEHFLWYFVRKEGCPAIIVQDQNQCFSLKEQFSKLADTPAKNEVSIKGVGFSMIHVKLRSDTFSDNFIALCASGRLVSNETLKGRLPGIYGRIKDNSGNYIHGTYVTSPFLDDSVLPDRDGFDLYDDDTNLFRDMEISHEDILNEVIGVIRDRLSNQIEQNKEYAIDRIRTFINLESPRYKPIFERLLDEEKYINPSISDGDLELHLHKCKMRLEHKIILEGKEIMQISDEENVEEYRARVHKYLQEVKAMKQSELAAYVTHRRVIIELLARAVRVNDEGQYSKEKAVHQLIMPPGFESTDASAKDSNLWLIDERLAFHNYLASDRPLKHQPITSSDSGMRPDIDMLHVADTPVLVAEGGSSPFSSLTIIELKRPMRGGSKSSSSNDPLQQVLKYLTEIRRGKVTTASGRPIAQPDKIPGYCYIISDLTDDVKSTCMTNDFSLAPDGLGYFRFYTNCNAYVEVISYDRLIKSAKERNRAFFEYLGLPAS